MSKRLKPYGFAGENCDYGHDKALDIMDEVGARAQVHAKPPKEVLDLEQSIVDIGDEKIAVVKSQRYEEAARLRDEERQLQEKLEEATNKWNGDSNETRKIITEDDVARVVAMTTGIPVNRVGTDDLAKLVNMEKELKSKVIGQDDAKRAVAIALRNRWRRSQLGDEMRNEVTPKNILMIGPTGVGKTEIARRLAKLANAPFVKVEATKFYLWVSRLF